MGSECPTCNGTGFKKSNITPNGDGSINANQLYREPCDNPACTVNKKREKLTGGQFNALQRKDIVISKIKATISAKPLQSNRYEIGTGVTLTDVKANEILDKVWETAHQSLRGAYQGMILESIECDGNLYQFSDQERPFCGHLPDEIKPLETPKMGVNKPIVKTITVADYVALPESERPSVSLEGRSVTSASKLEIAFDDHEYDVIWTLGSLSAKGDLLLDIIDATERPDPSASVDEVFPADPPKPPKIAEDSARHETTALLDDFEVWGDAITADEWLAARNLALTSDSQQIYDKVMEAFKAELRVKLESAGLKAMQSTIHSILGFNRVEDALGTAPFKTPADIRKRFDTRVEGELKRKEQEVQRAEARQKIDANQNAPLSNVIPPVQSTALDIPRANINPTVFGTGDPAFDLMVSKAEIMLKSGFLPSSIKNVQQVITICMMGEVLGLPMIVAVNSLNVINNRIAMPPQLMIALARQKGLLETLEIADEKDACTVTVKRKGETPHKATFTMDDARKLTTSKWENNVKKTIPLSEKDNWKEQPSVMLQWRAISKAFRVVFPDVINGLYTPEEVESFTEEAPAVYEKVVA